MTNSVATLLANLLPTAPAQLLLLGEDVGALAIDLMAQGYRVSHQRYSDLPEFVQHPSATRSGIGQVNISSATVASGPFHAVLIFDFSPAVHPLALFDRLAGLLVDGGMVLLTGPKSEGKPPRMAHWLDFVVVIAGRCGFAAQVPVETVGFSENDFFVRALRKTAAPRWQVSHVRPKDFTAVAMLFQEVFGHPMSPELWAWKYAAGRGNAVIARRGGEVIAHYGGMYRDVLIQGRPDWVFQICDVMVHPNERGVLTRQGPFLLTAATSAELYGPLGFGFPNARAMKVAEKMGLYAPADQMAEVHWTPSSTSVRLRSRVRPVGVAASDHKAVNALWQAMAHDLKDGVVGVRDWAYVEHRYVNHPLNRYDVLMVTARLSAKPLGVVVLRRHENGCELMDVIAPLANLSLVIDQARRMTARWGLPHLYCWVTERHAPRFVACEGTQKALDVMIPTSCWTEDPRADALKGKWWLMSGDTDFR